MVSKRTPKTPAAAATTAPNTAPDTAQAFSSAVGDALKSVSGLKLPLAQLAQIQNDYLKSAADVWNQSLQRLQTEGEAKTKPAPIADRRFAAGAWAANPATAIAAELYLLNARTMMQMADSVDGDAKTKARVRFTVQQWIDATSPSNFLALNPEALQKAIDTKGESIAAGMQHLLEDLKKGHVSQTDESVFEVGRNVATTEGHVVFENEFFQLLEYKPLTAKVYERPFLFVPPCINKYYILDLQPENSVIRYSVEQGHRTFVMSWRNPDDSMVGKTWDDYIENGPIAAIRAVQAITGQDTINTLGFCVGGTILSTALAVLAARGARLGKADAREFQPAASVTLLTTLLDFEDTGILDIFIDETMVQVRELTIGPDAPGGPGLLKGKELAATFSFLRPNDLVWNYVVGNYLKGETPPPFDLLYWNGDSTNLPGPMYCWYLRHMYLQNELKVPGRLTVCGVPVDLGAIESPFFIYASREDHIVPWAAAYRSVPLLKGKRTFVLGASGHIAGVINPPAKGKRSHWTNDRLPASAEAWFEGATEAPGSWWPAWSGWLAPLAGKQVAAPKVPGSAKFKPIEAAPGRYVKVKV
ncbi:Poly(3-hydroxyalkanoate) polymerase subunit PhaC [Rubrivivax sp. A210]|uniref:class I poly(R)-hydroxyalkanoic acid synthase n=1 Tax=Rubrivivax sp. A210 TaxID=2772301 RepID=UPI001918032F|nr:class I poly(R)-hydroxyalkanoic acid synthase [Rubrivivax sp. A210]CAD5372812.1 Poly(3-hydroxyalkanoate) polymerase subunit PhaC [Rubrivivax sp. A210]